MRPSGLAGRNALLFRDAGFRRCRCRATRMGHVRAQCTVDECSRGRTLRSTRDRARVAETLAGKRRVRRQARPRQEEVLRAGDVPLSVGAPAHGPRAQLHDGRRGRARAPHAGLRGAVPDGLGRVRAAGGERRDQGQGASARLDAVEHRAHARAVRRARPLLRLVARAHHLRAGLLRARAAHLHRDVEARASPTARARSSTGATLAAPCSRTSRSRTACAGAAATRCACASSRSGS